MEYYRAHKERIGHIHLHDASGKRNHLPLGEGEIDFKEKLKLAGNSVESIILETKTCEGLKRSLDYLSALSPAR